MPNEECIVFPYPKFEGVHLEYKTEMKHISCPWICYSCACQNFFEKIANVCLVCSKGPHVCCNICTSYQMQILKAQTDHEHMELKKLRLKNVKKQCLERLHYYVKAMQSPDIVDGMDQSKTNVPILSK